MMPPYMIDGRNTAELFMANMEYAGVSAAVVTQEYIDGDQNEYLLRVKERHPDRFFVCGLAEFRKPGYYEEVKKLIEKGFKGIKLPAQRLHDLPERVYLNEPEMMQVFELMEEKQIILSVDLAEGDIQTGEMEEVLQQFPKLKVAIGHFGMVNRPGWEELRRYLTGEMERLNVDVRLNTEFTADMARSEGADIVVVAIGSSTFRPSIPGMDRPNVLAARDVLEGSVQAKGKVVVAGGGCAGAQTAEFLADKGHDVTIIEMMSAIAIDAPGAERELLLGRLQRRGVKIMIDTKILSVEENGIGVQKPDGIETLPMDTVVVCMGSVSNDGLVDQLRPIVSDVIVVGDAIEPRKVTEALAEGALASLTFAQPLVEGLPRAA
jgi:hypothetical protein